MKTALVIEDNEDNMELITFILEASGYHAIRAETGLRGVELALTASPDFVILDIQLPDIAGPEVLRRIRAEETGAAVPIVAMTSHAMSGDRESLLAAGCTGYIEKPIDPGRVIQQLREVIGDEP